MSNENVHPAFKPILDSMSGDNKIGKIKIGDTVSTRHGIARVRAIEMFSPETAFPDDADNIKMTEIWECDKDRCVFDMDNNHWSWGYQVTLIKQPETTTNEPA
jgi:hypothetical protein